MFDRDQSGQIDINEFQALWNYIQQWRGVFDGFDRDRSGAIDVNELHNGRGSSNILYGFLNPNTTRIWVGGWSIASIAVRISEDSIFVHFYFNRFCSINVSN